jgi:hypothetical protein
MSKMYIVRAENRGAPESVICGVYPTKKLADARAKIVSDDWEIVWYDMITMGKNGKDCELYNR